ncbi:hypothetical protein C5E51_23370 [Nocardia nova]|uniref:hypothetical protein n=1 Tax=Nocardia nova TaxID=37330 RepID=UPI000CEA42A1|nr:hypothetical protein [Nocardia nova]PPJ05435.1 hypothetical protein C5E51_23370 [Nocardia nova]
MSVVLAGLITGIAANLAAVAGLSMRLRWKAIQRTRHRQQLVELVQILPAHSRVDSHDGPDGLRTRLTLGRVKDTK